MLVYFLLFVVVYFLMELIYFRIADRKNIIDKPNARSSHTAIVIRGGGIIFPLAMVLPVCFRQFEGDGLILPALLLVSLVSFVDDIHNLNSRIRFLIQSISVAMLLYQTAAHQPVYWLVIFFVLITGVINIYNFMDGINGITAIYSATVIGTLCWISNNVFYLLDGIFFASLLAALAVFSFFNLRKRAKCFAGDVGSISMAFIVCYLLLKLIIGTGYYGWVLLLGVYGVDAVCTIIFRIFRGENIFEAHRSHFYQFLANECSMSHVLISAIYGSVQLAINYIVVQSFRGTGTVILSITLFVIILIYIIFRLYFEGSRRLFKTY